MTGVHGLKHVKRFLATDFAEDDETRLHTETIDEQLTLTNGADAFDVWRPRFQSHDILLRELQFGCVFDGDNATCLRNVRRQDVEEMFA